MSEVIDNRVLGLQFDNSQFESGVQQSISSMNNLNNALRLKDSAQGISQAQSAVDSFDTSNMSSMLTAIENKFGLLSIAGITAIQRITNEMLTAAARISNALTSGLISGGKQRALNLEQANFQMEGLGLSAKDVKRAMSDALYAVEDTAYGLDSAAKAGSQLMASGVKIGKELRSSLRGISGVAAMTNSSYDDIANVFTRVAGNGRVMGVDLLTLSSRGLNIAATLGKQMHKSEKEIREMVTDGKISFKEFSDAMDAAYGEHAKDANKTFEGSLSNLKAALARIGANFFTPFYENTKDAINAIIPFVNAINKSLTPAFAYAEKSMVSMRKMLVSFFKSISKQIDSGKYIGNAEKIQIIISNVTKAIKNLNSVMATITKVAGKAFSYIFPDIKFSGILEAIVNISKGITKLIKELKPSGREITNIRYCFEGLFSIFKIGTIILKQVTNAFLELLSGIKPYGSVVLSIFGSLGKNITIFVQELEKTGSINIKPLLDFFKGLADHLPTAEELSAKVADGLNTLFNAIATAGPTVSDILRSIGDGIKGISEALKENLGSAKILEYGVFAVVIYWFRRLVLAVRNFIQTMTTFTGLNGFTTVLNQLRDTLLAMEKQLDWKVLTHIAGAVALLTASLVVLCMIPEDDLAKGLGAIALIIASLAAAMIALEKVLMGANIADILSKNLKGVNTVLTAFGTTMVLGELSNALIKLAISVVTLALAVKILGSLDVEAIVQGLISVAVILSGILAFTKIMDGTKLQNSVLGVMTLATSMVIFSAAVSILGSVDTSKLIKGLISIASLFIEIIIFSKVVDSAKLATSAVGVLAISAALLLLSSSLAILTNLDAEKLVVGITSIALLLGEIAAFSQIINAVNLVAIAPGILAISAALLIMSAAILSISVLDIGGIAKSLVAITVVLAELVIACNLMQNAVPGAVAMVIAASSLLILAVALNVISAVNPAALAVGLIGIAAAIAIFGVAAYVLAPVIPIMLSLSATLLIFGAAIAAIGIGIAAFAIGIATLAGITAAGIAAIGEFISGFCAMIITKLPEIGAAAVAIVETILAGLTTLIPKIVTFGALLILNLLEGLSKNIGKIADKAITIGVKFIKGLREGIEKHKDDLSTAIAELITTLIGGAIETIEKLFSGDLPSILTGAVETIGGFVSTLAESISGLIDSFSNFLDSIANLVTSVGNAIATVVLSAALALSIALDSIVTSLERLAAIDALSLAKALGTLGLAFAELIVAGAGLTPVAGTYEKVGKALADMGWGMEQVVKYSGFIDGALSRLKIALTNLDDAKDTLVNVADSFKQFADNMRNSKDQISAVADVFDRLKDSIGGMSSSMSLLSTDSNATANAFSSITSSVDGMAGFKDSLDEFVTAAEDTANRSDGLGSKIAENYNNGITSKSGAARDAGKELASNAESGLKSGNSWYSVGQDAGQGYVDGIKSKVSDAEEAAKKLVKAGVKKTAKTQESHSPSKVYKRLGAYASEGYALGILENLKMVANSSDSMAKSGFESMATSLSKASELWTEDLDTYPVITPVMDLDMLTTQAAVAAGMLSSFGIPVNINGQVKGINSTLTAQLQNKTSNLDVVNAINDLKSEILNRPQVINNNSVNGITYDDGSNIANAIGAIVNGVEMQTRAGVR